METVIRVRNLKKKFKKFQLDIPELEIPQGFATALIGENGAGKTTLLNLLAGIRLDYCGDIEYFGKWKNDDRDKKESGVRERIGYTGPGSYFLPHWTIKQVGEVSELLFEGFHLDRYQKLCRQLAIVTDSSTGKKSSELSDGNRMKLMLASVLARDTDLLILDEPASPLDPLMREKLCEMIRSYLAGGSDGIADDSDCVSGGSRSVFFSTHNISDMESVTDYCMIMEQGRIVEQGFVEDLKEKYVMVKGEAGEVQSARKVLYSITESKYGYEGICLTENLDQLAGLSVACEVPTLFQISVAVMKKNSSLQFT